MAVGRQCEVERFPFKSLYFRQFVNECNHAIAQQWFATSDADLFNPHGDKYLRHAQVVGEWKIAIERPLVAGTAVDALVVAPVSDRDPQIGDGAAEFVGKRHGC